MYRMNIFTNYFPAHKSRAQNDEMSCLLDESGTDMCPPRKPVFTLYESVEICF